MGRRNDIDWELVERDVRLGHLSLTEITKKYGIARSSLNRKMNENGWTRDLSETVKAATKAAIQAERAVKAKELSDSAGEIGREIGKEIGRGSDSGAISDIQALAASNVVADRRHRTIAEKIVNIASALHDELESVSGNPKDIRELIDMVGGSDDEAMADLASELRKILSLPSRATVLDKLASAATKAITIEREILGLNEQDPADGNDEPLVIMVNGVKVDG